MAQRSKKTTKKQFEELITFIENHKVLVGGGRTKPRDEKVVEELWNHFASNVSNSEYGPVKSAKQWRKVWSEWKVNTKRKSREIEASKCKAEACSRVLNDLEMRVLAILNDPLPVPKTEELQTPAVATGQTSNPSNSDVDVDIKKSVSDNESMMEDAVHEFIQEEGSEEDSMMQATSFLLNNANILSKTFTEGTGREQLNFTQFDPASSTTGINEENTNEASAKVFAKALNAFTESIQAFTEAYKMRTESDLLKAKADMLRAEADMLKAKSTYTELKILHNKAVNNIEEFEIAD